MTEGLTSGATGLARCISPCFTWGGFWIWSASVCLENSGCCYSGLPMTFGLWELQQALTLMKDISLTEHTRKTHPKIAKLDSILEKVTSRKNPVQRRSRGKLFPFHDKNGDLVVDDSISNRMRIFGCFWRQSCSVGIGTTMPGAVWKNSRFIG